MFLVTTTTNTQIAQHFYLQHHSLSLIYSLFNLSQHSSEKYTGLPCQVAITPASTCIQFY